MGVAREWSRKKRFKARKAESRVRRPTAEVRFFGEKGKPPTHQLEGLVGESCMYIPPAEAGANPRLQMLFRS